MTSNNKLSKYYYGVHSADWSGSALVYCPTGEVIFQHFEHKEGSDTVRSLLEEACHKINPREPIKVWRVPDISSYGERKNVSAFMNMQCMYDDSWEVNDFAESLAILYNGDLRLRGPIVLVIPKE